MRSSGGLTRRLWPEHGLVTVSWIAALALLVLNDHVLKHAGILPGWLTGKVSDFAGLYVAPALLASVLRANTRLVLAACHVAVGAMFAAINLDAGCAALCVRALAALGLHWTIVTDAADLIALPALLASWHGLGSAMQRPRASGPVLRATQSGLVAAGALACLASSDEYREDLYISGPHLHNSTDGVLSVLVRPLRSDVLVDCDRVAKDPARMLPDSAFDSAVAYELDPFVNTGLGVEHEGCGAAIVTGSDLATVLLFWRDEDLPPNQAPAEYNREKDWQPGAVVLRPGKDGLDGYHSVGGDFVFALDRSAGEAGTDCALPEPSALPALTLSVAQSASYRLTEVRPGFDGCFALELARTTGAGAAPPLSGDEDAGTAGGDAPEPTSRSSYLCVPDGMFPFDAGDIIRFDTASDGSWFLLTRNGADGKPEVQLHLGLVSASDGLAKLALSVRPLAECGFQRRTGSCAETAVPAEAEVLLGSERVRLRSGDPALRVTSLGVHFEIAVPFVEWRAVSDSECGGALGANGWFVVVMRPEGR